MNQEKTGAFIAQLRKESNMTQVQLADELGFVANHEMKYLIKRIKRRSINVREVSRMDS